jgi:hypothetical protein
VKRAVPMGSNSQHLREIASNRGFLCDDELHARQTSAISTGSRTNYVIPRGAPYSVNESSSLSRCPEAL